MPTVPFDPLAREHFAGSVVSSVNAMRGRLPYEGFIHVGANRYVLADPPLPSRPIDIGPPMAVEAPDQGPRSSPGARAIWPDLK
jgi:hypothetical protein